MIDIPVLHVLDGDGEQIQTHQHIGNYKGFHKKLLIEKSKSFMVDLLLNLLNFG